MLYLVATPIGNLDDITLRALDTLRRCDAVYCEDTRRTSLLLRHFEIEKPLFSCHSHNEKKRSAEVAAALREGKEIVYVSDAGMPAISDPGETLVKTCIENDLPFTVVPGASAVLTAAVLSGLVPQPFSFFGFLPRENGPRAKVLDAIASAGHLCILYESPRRVKATLEELLARLGDCDAAVLRELTKKFETSYRGKLSDLALMFGEEPKGECVIALLPDPQAGENGDPAALADALLETMSVKDAAVVLSEKLHIPKKRAYAVALERKNRASGQAPE